MSQAAPGSFEVVAQHTKAVFVGAGGTKTCGRGARRMPYRKCTEISVDAGREGSGVSGFMTATVRYRSLKVCYSQAIALAMNVLNIYGCIFPELSAELRNIHIQAAAGNDAFVFPSFFQQ